MYLLILARVIILAKSRNKELSIMAHKNVHTTYNSNAKNWRNITEGATKPAKVYDTKAEAQAPAGRWLLIDA